MVIASEAKQSHISYLLEIIGLLRHYAPRNDKCLDFLQAYQGRGI